MQQGVLVKFTATKLILGCFCIGLVINSIESRSILQGDEKPCTTPGCLRVADYLKESIDYDTNPCDDFYKFACGKGLQRKQNDSSEVIFSFYDSMLRALNQMHMLILDTHRFPSKNNTNLLRLRNYYVACENNAIIDSLGNRPLMDVIRKVGGFPILGEPSGWLPENEKKITWTDRLIKYRALGVEHNFLFELSVQANLQNNSLTEIYLDEPQPSPEDVMVEMGGFATKAIEYGLTVSRLTNLGASVFTTTTYHLPKVYALKSSLANIKNNLEYDYTQIKINEFQSLGLSFDMPNLINQLVGRELSGHQVINVNYEYLIKLDKLLAKSDPKVVANYMLYRMMQDLGSFLDQTWSLRQRDCITTMQSEMDLAISHEYVKHFVSNGTRDAVQSLVDTLKNQTKINIEQAEWIKGSTVQTAKDKVDSMKSIVAYPPELMNETFIEQLLQPMVMKPDDFFGNHLKIKMTEYDYMYNKIGKDQRGSNWELFAHTTETNAFYAPHFNSINILAGILLERVYDKTSPQYLNFGSIGSIIGHEITHAFDPSGSRFDKSGNMLPSGSTWWNSETRIGFERNKQCIIKAYDGLPVPGTEHAKVDGKFTLGENMADNGGYQISHEAYKLWVKEQGVEREQLLPDLKFNQDQLFWLSLATTWCDVIDPQTAEYLSKADVHSPYNYRVNIPFANSKAFSEAFQCSQGTNMNPADKCVVW